jgi:hypothetical protein
MSAVRMVHCPNQGQFIRPLREPREQPDCAVGVTQHVMVSAPSERLTRIAIPRGFSFSSANQS